jgi:hypothetical protein
MLCEYKGGRRNLHSRNTLSESTKRTGAKVHEHTFKSRSAPRVGPHLECEDTEIRSTPFVLSN